jgi:hypothetical protein
MIKWFISRLFRSRYLKVSEMVMDYANGRGRGEMDDFLGTQLYGSDEITNQAREKIIALMMNHGGISLSSPEAKADLLAIAEELQAKGR